MISETVFLSLIPCLLSALRDTCCFFHNLTSTEIHLCITFKVYTFFHWPSTQRSVLLLFHVSLLRSLSYRPPHVIIVSTLSGTYQFTAMLAHAILRKSWSSLVLEKQWGNISIPTYTYGEARANLSLYSLRAQNLE